MDGKACPYKPRPSDGGVGYRILLGQMQVLTDFRGESKGFGVEGLVREFGAFCLEMSSRKG